MERKKNGKERRRREKKKRESGTYRWIAHASSHLIGCSVWRTVSTGEAATWTHFHFIGWWIHRHGHASTVEILFEFQRLSARNGGVEWRWRINFEIFFFYTVMKWTILLPLRVYFSSLSTTPQRRRERFFAFFFVPNQILYYFSIV